MNLGVNNSILQAVTRSPFPFLALAKLSSFPIVLLSSQASFGGMRSDALAVLGAYRGWEAARAQVSRDGPWRDGWEVWWAINTSTSTCPGSIGRAQVLLRLLPVGQAGVNITKCGTFANRGYAPYPFLLLAVAVVCHGRAQNSVQEDAQVWSRCG